MVRYYTYESDIHCVDCALDRFWSTLDDAETRDSEGNPIGVVFTWDEGPDYDPVCGDCLELID